MHDQVQLEHSKFTCVVQAQLQLEVQLEVQLLVTALLLVGLVSSSCSDSELNFGSVVGDSEDLKLKFKSKFKFKSKSITSFFLMLSSVYSKKLKFF